jgi:hypothetical protein
MTGKNKDLQLKSNLQWNNLYYYSVYFIELKNTGPGVNI